MPIVIVSNKKFYFFVKFQLDISLSNVSRVMPVVIFSANLQMIFYYITSKGNRPQEAAELFELSIMNIITIYIRPIG